MAIRPERELDEVDLQIIDLLQSNAKWSNKEIADFCKNTYDVKFPMFAKSEVSGARANPLFKHLIEKSGTTPKWNFYKYLINRRGEVVDSYNSMTKPSSKSVTSKIEKLLAE